MKKAKQPDKTNRKDFVAFPRSLSLRPNPSYNNKSNFLKADRILGQDPNTENY